MQGAAMLAGTHFLVAVEGAIDWRQIVHDAVQIEFDTMNESAAVEAVPLESVKPAVRALGFHN